MGQLRQTLIGAAHALSTRRLLSLLSLILVFSTLGILFSYNPADTVSHFSQEITGFTPKIGSPFGAPVHKPGYDFAASSSSDSSTTPADGSAKAGSTAAPTKWFGSSWWHNPFSSSIATAEDRIALPMLDERCVVYTYHDPDVDKEVEEAEDRVLLAWRRAWWANGFMPIILGQAEAKTHPLWQKLEGMKVTPELKKELVRWLAWGTQGRGTWVNHRIIPMGPLNDETLVTLRKCSHFDSLKRYEDFEGKFYSSDKSSLDKVLEYLLSSSSLEKATTIEEAISTSPDAEKLMKVAPSPKALADYNPNSLSHHYGEVNPSELADLINSHLHATFLSFYSDGIEYLAPFANKLNAVHEPAVLLTHRLANCPVNPPHPGSCPPNNPSCTPCRNRVAISSRPNYQNSTSSFLVGIVPHPYTTVQFTYHDVSLARSRKDRVIRFIRRKLRRDPWLKKVTEEAFDHHNVGSQPRVVKMKEVIVSPPRDARVGIWGTDTAGFKDVEWILGFTLPTAQELNLKLPQVEKKDSEKLEEALKAVAKCKGSQICKALEAWCLADTELWNFANAWTGRREEVRVRWSKEERRFGKGLALEER